MLDNIKHNNSNLLECIKKLYLLSKSLLKIINKVSVEFIVDEVKNNRPQYGRDAH